MRHWSASSPERRESILSATSARWTTSSSGWPSLVQLESLRAGGAPTEPFDLAELVHSLLTLVRPHAERRRVEVRTDITGSARVGSGRDLVEIALLNVLANSLEAVDAEGWVGISVRAIGSSRSARCAIRGPGCLPLRDQIRRQTRPSGRTPASAHAARESLPRCGGSPRRVGPGKARVRLEIPRGRRGSITERSSISRYSGRAQAFGRAGSSEARDVVPRWSLVVPSLWPRVPLRSRRVAAALASSLSARAGGRAGAAHGPGALEAQIVLDGAHAFDRAAVVTATSDLRGSPPSP
jgi:hypothetical protein